MNHSFLGVAIVERQNRFNIKTNISLDKDEDEALKFIKEPMYKYWLDHQRRESESEREKI